ncbi:MAG: hypothetical protein A2X64_03980 [Ignavibacteria bacterium GWF2_33_9]|nr:MAG: hypothetical protein A2X64_03980 [Ignavibacteria bacterium GWF2_33_9]
MKNKILIALAMLLGIIAVFAGNPQLAKKQDNLNEFYATHIMNEISPIELAKNIIDMKADMRILDLRSKEKYNENSLVGAENIDKIELYQYNKKKMLVLVGDEEAVRKAYYKFYTNGYFGVVVLKDGMEGWENYVVKPNLAGNPNAKEIYYISLHFLGQPTGYVESAPAITSPTTGSDKPAKGGAMPVKKKAPGGGGC